MLRAVAVPVQGSIPDPRAARRLRVRFTGAALPVEEMSSARQQVESADETEIVVTVSAGRLPARGAVAAEADEELGDHLKATPFVQSAHPDIVARARAIVEGKTDPLVKARAIYDWVHRKVEKAPTVSLPSAVDVLRVMRGDCNEHTYLFVALARAAGLPAKIQIGLLYTEGAFYYHAWPAVFAGEWLEMDPTIGQEAVDAAHVALLEGELASQLRLLGMIGKLKAEVLEQEY